MRYPVLFFIAMSISCSTFAQKVVCYNSGKMIYSHKAHEINYIDGLLSFTEDDTDDFVLVDADCIIKI